MMSCFHSDRRVVSPWTVSKYAGLECHLKFRVTFTNCVKLSFARIDCLIGSNLPIDAYRDLAWWSNTSSSIHTKAWLNAGWEVQEVNLKEGNVTFKKVRSVAFKKSKQKKLEITKPVMPVPVHRPRSKIPSKTKVSKLYARIKNLERQRAMPLQPVTGLKFKANNEKRFSESNEKPQ
jgi:hypothetical protein